MFLQFIETKGYGTTSTTVPKCNSGLAPAGWPAGTVKPGRSPPSCDGRVCDNYDLID